MVLIKVLLSCVILYYIENKELFCNLEFLESGRQLKITAGMKYQPINETNTLFELIEQMQIQPIETPL